MPEVPAQSFVLHLGCYHRRSSLPGVVVCCWCGSPMLEGQMSPLGKTRIFAGNLALSKVGEHGDLSPEMRGEAQA